MRFRGAFIVSRVATVAPERISAYAFLAVSYIAPSPDSDYETGRKVTAQLAGYEIFGEKHAAVQRARVRPSPRVTHTEFSLTPLKDENIFKLITVHA